ncbi:anoctamin-9 [Trichomycterus rosablanca]|uniref:anoctamin-9 n=1 Tax=Trichomycterus rosablanca TaxID=2290929 RepID=UPI002F354788
MFRSKRRKDDIELQVRNKNGIDNATKPLLQPSISTSNSADRSFNCILVAHVVNDKKDQKFKKREAYIKELKSKNLKVTKIKHDDLVFYGVRAPEEIINKYKYLLKVSDSCNWSGEQEDCIQNTTRIRIVHFILHHTYIGTGERLRDLTRQNVFEVLFCLHERTQQEELKKKWANWMAIVNQKCVGQPINEIRKYFGEKVALYFLWLGWYTMLLVPAAIIGLVVFLYALAFFDSNPLIKEICESNVTMCPTCDKRCQVWKLSDTCFYAKLSHLFDNEGTVAFAMFMALWATLFLELWKRHRSHYVSKWKVFDWCEEEEELVLNIVNDPNCKPKEYKHSYFHSTLVLLLVTLVLVVIIGLTHALVISRVVSAMLLSESEWKFVSDHANLLARILGAVLHYITMQIMTRVNRIVAFKLCEIEETRSFAATERNFTVKMFTFQFFTLFSSLIYVAFFLGRINGYPGNYVRIAGKWRLEECHPSGCLTDLFIQMAIILILKQTLSNIFEFVGPWFKVCWAGIWFKKELKKCGSCRSKCDKNNPYTELCDLCNLQDWLRNYNLINVHSFSLFNEFLEMVIQFSFTTIFVAACPLAPLFALINNIFEIRLDAIKMLRLERRLVPKKTNDIGVWTKVLEAVGVTAVIANGLVIGISSEFVPRLLYRYRFGPCANGTATDLQCMSGYTDYTLTTAYMSDINVRQDFTPSQMVTSTGLNVTECSYKDYRSNSDHTYTPQYWLILAARFAFVILFEHVVVICKFIIAWFVPDNPIKVKNSRLRDKLNRLKKEFWEQSARFDSMNTESVV